MQLSELIRRVRVQSNDKVEPYFHEDQDIISWLNEAVDEACIRGRLVHESQNNAVCSIAVLANQSHYPLHESLFEITSLVFNPVGERAVDLQLCSEEYLDRYYMDNWRVMTDTPKFAVQSDTAIRLIPTPVSAGSIRIEGYRTALTELQQQTDTPSDLHKQHHIHLIEWVLFKAFSIPDTEFFDPNRSQIAYQNFEQYFGIRPDSDLRRITREDVPHAVVPFMP